MISIPAVSSNERSRRGNSGFVFTVRLQRIRRAIQLFPFLSLGRTFPPVAVFLEKRPVESAAASLFRFKRECRIHPSGIPSGRGERFSLSGRSFSATAVRPPLFFLRTLPALRSNMLRPIAGTTLPPDRPARLPLPADRFLPGCNLLPDMLLFPAARSVGPIGLSPPEDAYRGAVCSADAPPARHPRRER